MPDLAHEFLTDSFFIFGWHQQLGAISNIGQVVDEFLTDFPLREVLHRPLEKVQGAGLKAKAAQKKMEETPSVIKESPKIENIKEDSPIDKNEMTPGQSSTPEIVKPVKKKEIPSVTPAMEPGKKKEEKISPFDDNMFPPNKKKKLPPLDDPRKLPPIESKPAKTENVSLVKEAPVKKEEPAPQKKEIPKEKPVISPKKDPVKEVQPQEEVIGTDSSLKLSEGAILEAQDYVSDMFSRTKQMMKPKNVPFKYQQYDGGTELPNLA